GPIGCPPQISLITPLNRPPRTGTRDGGRPESPSRRLDGRRAVGDRATPPIYRSIRKPRSQAAVRAPAVVMRDPLAKDRAKVPLCQWNHDVQTLSTDCADQALAKGVRLWNAGWGLENVQTHRLKGSIDGNRVNRVSIVDHESVPQIAR